MKIKRILCVILGVLLMNLLACGSVNDDALITNPPEYVDSNDLGDGEKMKDEIKEEDVDPATFVVANQKYRLAEIARKIKLLGRIEVLENGISCDNTASGIAFNAYTVGQVKIKINCSSTTYFTVYLDGERLEERFCVNSSNSNILINIPGEISMHEIRLLKQTEAQVSLCEILSLEFYGYLASRVKKNTYYIEYIGDSITAGYGNLCSKGTSEPGSALNQDGTKAFPFLTAERLNADCSVISCSGIGVDKGYTTQNELEYYPITSFYRNKESKFDFSKARTPDIVVINLGTNDADCRSTETQFKKNARDLINMIRNNYGTNVKIVWSYGMMGASCETWIDSVISRLGGSEKGLYTCQLPKSMNGGNSHPAAVGHEEATTVFAEFLEGLLK